MKIKTNKELVELHQKGALPSMRAHADELGRKIEALKQELDSLEADIAILDQVGEVIDEVAISKWGLAAVMDKGRTAEIYPNANNEGRTFGLRIVSRDTSAVPAWGRETWCGAGWSSKDAARKAALDWIIHGRLPQFDGTGPTVREPR